MTGTRSRVRRLFGSGRALRLALATSLIASAVVVVAELPVRAATQTFTATADAQVREASPSTSFGTTTALRVDAGTDPDVESYLRFAVSGVSGSVQTATLRVWVTSSTANGPAVYTTDDTWSETTITWANRTARTGSGVDDKGSVPSGAYVDFNVTSLVPGDGTYNFVLAGTSTDGVDLSSREAANKPQLVVTTAASGDLTNPSDPTNLGASAISSSRVDLSWTGSTDNIGVTGYEIFRNSTLLTTVGAVTTYADTTVAPSTGYAYQARALDAAGNRSGFSASASATTPAAPTTTTSTFAPTADAYVAEATSSTNFGTSTTLRVDAGTDPDVETYIRFPVSGLTGTIQSAKLRLWVGTDATGNGPAVYTTASTWSEGSITWGNRTARVGAGTDDKASIPTNSWVEYNVASLVAGNATYDFVLAGTSTDGINFSSREAATNKPQLVIVTQASGDTQNPSDPSLLSATPTSGTRVDLSWTGSTDNTAVTNYEIFRNGSLLTTVGNVTVYADTSVANATTYDYKVRAVDGAGNRSGFSNTSSVTTPDTQSPTSPTQVNATAFSSNRVDLTWTAGTDNVGVTNYEIYRDTTLLTTVGAVTTYTDSTVSPATTYTYALKAVDAAGNHSGLSNSPSATTPAPSDGESPTDPADLSATAVGPARIDLTWTASGDNIAVTNYEIYRGGVLLTTVGNVTSFSDLAVDPATTYSYQVKARDAAGNRSGFSNTATESTPADTVDPQPPSNLVATVVTSTRVDLSWTAGSDNVGVTNYEIFRGGSLLTTVGNVTSYSDTTVLAGATYSYQVRAMDAVAHRSTLSNTATVTTTDGTAPSQPTNLLASAAAYNRIDLSWTASTDNVAVTNYEIYRGGVLLTTVGAVTSYSDAAVNPGTGYAYQVKAMDLAGNRSAFSNTSSATTPQQAVTLIPTADARVEQATPTTNFGTATALRVDAGSTPVESYLLFNASGLAGTLRHATLRVWASSGTADGPAVYTSPTNWTETGITWATRPTRTGAGTDDKAGISTGTWVEYDVTSLMTGNGTWSFVLAGSSSDGVDFHSKEGTNDPQLVITMGAADTHAPTAPTLSGAAPSPTQVDLSWTTATDDVAVTGYDLYRGATLLASLGLVNTFSDTTVSANTTYTYTVKARDRAGNISGPSNAVSIRTPTSGGTSPIIATAGDIACANTDAAYNGGAGTSIACQQAATSNLLVNAGYAAVLVLGDNQYNSGSLTQFNAVYNPTWGRVKSITHPSIGNHEYGTSNASGYFTYFGSAAGDPAKGYYSYDIGTWHVVTLNSNCTIVACTAGSAQEQWLRADLSAHPSACTVATTHHARWSSGHDGDNVFLQPLWQALIDGGVDVLLSGHSHNYERFAPQNASGGLDNTNGIRQFVVGTGGAFFTGVGSAHANSQVRNNDTFGILKMTLRPTGYDWQFIRAAGGSFTDSGSTACH